MKKSFYYLLLLPLFLFTFVSCVDRDDNAYQNTDTIGVVYELQSVSFQLNNSNEYVISREFQNPIYNGDVILIYRKSGTTSNGSPVWQQIPRTLYVPQGELDYDFDFSRYDILITAGGNYDIATTPEFLTGQTFRVVVVPASATGSTKMDYSNYENVINQFNLKNAKVVNL